MTTSAAKKTTAVNLEAEEYAHPGNRACTGCTLNTLYRVGLKALGRDCIFAVPPSCLTVVQGLYPISSSPIERVEDFTYISYDNEAYMNTGVQRSGTTPKGVLTNNTPSGKVEQKKDIPAIVAAHKPAYVASCSAAYPLDFHDKLLKAKQIKGFKYFHIHTPCPPGWGVEERMAIAVGKTAVDSGLFDLYEIVMGEFKLTGPSQKLLRKKKLPPIGGYFDLQARFRKLQPEYIEALQQEVDAKWAGYRETFL